uniref:Phlebovirus_G2 domain-containing protein n=1 Tax=Heligmosomoides polygyrus TaxID=6339 RepID=A0A183GP78_HELPZ
LCLVNINESCQQVEVFSHSSIVCEKFEEGEICRVHVSEVLQVNPFKKEACLRLLRGNASVHEFRVTWQTLTIFCEPETIMFIRDTTQQEVSSHGFLRRKCEDVNSTSMLPELEEGNKYPGSTACVESCGGPGCDCFYLSSGRLFYRIYVVPESPKVYEIYKCNRWNEAAKVKFTHTDIVQGKTQYYTAFMSPNVPVSWKSFTATLSSITVPPLPILNSFFITDNTSTALWDSKLIPALQCQDKGSAENLDCEVRDKCWMSNIQRRLPVVLSALSFRRSADGQVWASVPSMTTAEIILNVQDKLRTDITTNSAVCSIENAVVTGCYKCAKGAETKVTCRASKKIHAEVTCGDASFTIECDEKGIKSALKLSFRSARVYQKCRYSCGRGTSTFEIARILKFTRKRAPLQVGQRRNN